MAINGPPVVASDGRSAAKTSLSGLARASSESQKAISSQMTATAVMPRMVRKLAERTPLMSTPGLQADDVVGLVRHETPEIGHGRERTADEVERLRGLLSRRRDDRDGSALACREHRAMVDARRQIAGQHGQSLGLAARAAR